MAMRYKNILSYFFSLFLLFPLCLKSACPGPTTILEFLTTSSTIKLQDWLQNILYIRTNPIRSQYPSFSPTLAPSFIPECSSWKVSPFYNGTLGGVYFNHDDTSLTSVIDVSSLSLSGSGDIFDLIFETDPFKRINFPLLGDLFDNIIVQQNRLGFMGQYTYSWKDYYFTAYLPFMYQIQNVYIEPELQDRFSNELAIPFAAFEIPGDRNAVEDFIKKHMIADRIGIGHLDLIVGKIFDMCDGGQITLALEGIIPTEVDFRKGLIGGCFDPVPWALPPFSLYSFASNVIDPNNACFSFDKAFNTMINIFEDMLDRITTAYYDVPLGLQSFGIGLQSTGEKDINESTTFGYFARFLYQIPRHAIRFAYVKTPASEFDRNYNTTSNEAALQDLDFLSRQFLYRVLLIPLEAKRTPGIELQGRFYARVNSSDIHVTLGFDGWCQQKESIEIKKTPHVYDEGAYVWTEQQACGQFKIFGIAEAIYPTCCTDLVIGGFVDITLASFGIGKDLTLGISFGSSF